MNVIFVMHPDSTPIGREIRDEKFIELYETVGGVDETLLVPILGIAGYAEVLQPFLHESNIYPITCTEETNRFPTPEQIEQLDGTLIERYGTSLGECSLYLAGQEKTCCVRSFAEAMVFGTGYYRELGDPVDFGRPRTSGDKISVLQDYTFGENERVRVTNPETEESVVLPEVALDLFMR